MIKLKHVKPKLEVSKNIAIVGSSGRLRECPQGELIDSFDDVIRFNRAPTKNWETECGSKTTMRMANSHVFVGKPLVRGSWVQKDTKFIKRIKNSKIIVYGNSKFWARREASTDPSSECFQISPSCNQIVKAEMPTHVQKQLTVGMVFIGICIVSGIVPHVFGFDIEDDRPRDHYWEDRGPASKFHTPSDEKKLLIALEKSGKIILY